MRGALPLVPEAPGRLWPARIVHNNGCLPICPSLLRKGLDVGRDQSKPGLLLHPGFAGPCRMSPISHADISKTGPRFPANIKSPRTSPIPLEKRDQKRIAWPSQKKKTVITKCNIHQGSPKSLNRFMLPPQHMAGIVKGRYSDEVNDPPTQIRVAPGLPFLFPIGIVAEELEIE
jgi:hypothetical protein